MGSGGANPSQRTCWYHCIPCADTRHYATHGNLLTGAQKHADDFRHSVILSNLTIVSPAPRLAFVG